MFERAKPRSEAATECGSVSPPDVVPPPDVRRDVDSGESRAFGTNEVGLISRTGSARGAGVKRFTAADPRNGDDGDAVEDCCDIARSEAADSFVTRGRLLSLPGAGEKYALLSEALSAVFLVSP